MRDQPQPIGDPYRVLGLQPGASMAEVKRAYRRLAKAYHPDSAGEAALPRFLAIHEAYERLVTGRSRAGAGPRGARPAQSAPPAEPWRADPERARAAREGARTGRGWGSATGSTGRGAAGGTHAGAAGRAGTGGRTGTTGSGGAGASGASAASTSGAGSGAREGRRRHVRKATLGSTSYDEARDVTDATWSGASWYGPSSGEYWIVNPREYADPRKHGPAYQQRARGASATTSAAFAAGDGAEADVMEPDAELDDTRPGADAGAEAEAASSAASARAASPRASARGAGASDATPRASARSGAGRDARRWDDVARARRSAQARSSSNEWAAAAARLPGDHAPRSPMDTLGAAGRELFAGPGDDPIRRLGIALVAWPPIGLAAAATIGDLTGCATYSAACGGSDTLLPWLAQAVILGLLLLVPALARLFVGGTLAVLAALIPATALLVVVGGGGQPQSAFALGVLLAVAWLGGVLWAARNAGRGVPPEDGA